MEIRIYFEGNKALRSGFEIFFTELTTAAGDVRSTVKFVPAKDGPTAYRKAERSHPQAWNILLQDSEGPAPAQRVNNIFWMVELMEAWFLADPKLSRTTMAKTFVATRSAILPTSRESQKRT